MECSSCGIDVPASKFQTYTANGKTWKRKQCTSCKTSKQRERRLEIKAKIDKIKATSCCNRCGFSDVRALQFHHDKGEKETNIADAVKAGWGIQRLLSEVDKCTVLCANCHLIVHSEER